MEKTINKDIQVINENERIIANILHDIKSPLYSIKIGLQNKLDCELNKDIFETTLDIIDYIERFLTNYNFKQGKFKNKPIPCDIKKIIDKKIELYKYIFINKNIHIDIYCNDENYIINSIPIFLSSIIGNIISNIAFHANNNSIAKIEIYRKHNSIYLDFKNTYNDDSNNFSLGLDFCHNLANATKVNLKYSKTQHEVIVNLKIPSI